MKTAKISFFILFSILINQATFCQNPSRIIKGKDYFTKASNGLNYRNKPNGDIIGVFYMNSKVKVVEKTGIQLEIMDQSKNLKGEWIGVLNDLDTVYVFSEFLSEKYTNHNLNLYYVEPYIIHTHQKASINLTESFMWDVTLFDLNKLGENIININKYGKYNFLKSINIPEDSKVYIYNINSDSVFTFNLQDYPLYAKANLYAQGDETISEDEYEIHLDLNKEYTKQGQSIAFIGKRNPFVTGQKEKMIWKKIDETKTTISISENTLSKNGLPKYFKPNGNLYFFSRKGLEYYIQMFEKESEEKKVFVIIDSKTKSVLFEEIQSSSEGTSPNSIHYGDQWVGEIFKNKPTLFTGFFSYSFGCPGFHFIDQNQSSIGIKCNNRH